VLRGQISSNPKFPLYLISQQEQEALGEHRILVVKGYVQPNAFNPNLQWYELCKHEGLVTDIAFV
jgi:hypothetical protein